MSRRQGKRQVTHESGDFRNRFESLREAWKAETAYSSSMSEILLSLPYQSIIGMGPAVVPLIIEDFEREADHWDWALRAITGECPVPEEREGDIDDARLLWLEWWRAHGERLAS